MQYLLYTCIGGPKGTDEPAAEAIGRQGPISIRSPDTDGKGDQAATEQLLPYSPPSHPTAVDSKSDTPERLTFPSRDVTESQKRELVRDLSSPSTPITPVGGISGKILQRAAHRLGPDWKRVCRELGVVEDDITAVSSDYREDIQEQAFQGLRKWRQSQGAFPDIDCLVSACKRVGRNDVAESLLNDTEGD